MSFTAQVSSLAAAVSNQPPKDLNQRQRRVYGKRPHANAARQAVIDCLTDSKAPMTVREIADVTKMTRQNVRHVCLRLEADGELNMDDSGTFPAFERRKAA